MKRVDSGRYLPMSDDEVWELLHASRVMRLASVRPDGDPHVVPMWYVPLDGEIGVRSASDATTKMRNLLGTGRFAAVVDVGGSYQELRGVMLRGSVQEADKATEQRIVDGFAQRYYDGAEGLSKLPEAVQRKLEGLTFTYLRLIPESVVSWDNRKWMT